MHMSTRWQWLLLVVMTLALFNAAPAAGRTPSAPPGPAGAVPSAPNDVFLPLLQNPPASTAVVEFALSVDEFGDPIDPTTTFPAGTTSFYATVMVRDQNGTLARLNYVRPSGRGNSVTSPIESDAERVTVQIRSIDSGPLESGNYTVEVLIDETTLYARGVASIQ